MHYWKFSNKTISGILDTQIFLQFRFVQYKSCGRRRVQVLRMKFYRLHAAANRFGLLVVITLGGCATHTKAPGALQGQGNATLVTVGDVGLGIRTIHSTKPTAFIYRIDDQTISTGDWGYPASVATKPGKAVLYIRCVLNVQALTGKLQPFVPLEDGIGNVIGPTGGISAQIKLTANLQANRTYEVRCEPIGNYRARAWVTEQH